MTADSLDAIVVPDECPELVQRMLEQLSVADAQTRAALAVVRDLVMLVRYQGGHLWTWQQDIMTKAQLLLDEHGIEWRAPPRKP